MSTVSERIDSCIAQIAGFGEGFLVVPELQVDGMQADQEMFDQICAEMNDKLAAADMIDAHTHVCIHLDETEVGKMWFHRQYTTQAHDD